MVYVITPHAAEEHLFLIVSVKGNHDFDWTVFSTPMLKGVITYAAPYDNEKAFHIPGFLSSVTLQEPHTFTLIVKAADQANVSVAPDTPLFIMATILAG